MNSFFNNIFINLQNLLQNGSFFSYIAAFFWGLLSIILSPCHISSIPLAIAYINGSGNIKNKKAFILSSLFGSGVLLSLLIVGIITFLTRRMLGDIGKAGMILIGFIFIIAGLLIMELIYLPQIQFLSLKKRNNKSNFGALIFGVLFGLSLGPCTFGFIMPLLIVAFNAASKNIFNSILLLLLFGIGHISIIIAAGTLINIVEKYLKWNSSSKGVRILRIICGLLIIFTGLYLIIKQFIVF